jgi:hypothetical protein
MNKPITKAALIGIMLGIAIALGLIYILKLY